jgi:hypothetical protein
VSGHTSGSEHTSGRRLTGRLPLLLTLAFAALGLAGCGGSGSSATAPTATVTTTTAAAGPPLLTSQAQKVTFEQAKQAIDSLYEQHPAITGYVVRDVAYNAITRDKVLEVCRSGGRETEPASLESVRVAGCAPLIFYYYNYGVERSVPESIAVARKLYWYAATSIRGPFDARQTLAGLLTSWGLR